MDFKAHERLQLRLFFLFILCLQFNNSTLLSFYEGDDAELVFHYHNLNNIVVSLHVSKRPMFYHSGNMSMVGLTPKQRSRFSVVETAYEGVGSHMNTLMIRVRISNVTREDAGTFLCIIYQNGEIQNILTKKIGLQVEFPPGKATCEIEGSFYGKRNGIWDRVHCKALVGSLQGFIDCYQDGEEVPPWTRLVQNRTTLKQTLWIKRAQSAHCCTSNYERPTERCSCKDFGWDPIIGIIPQDKIDPCGITQVESNSEPTVLSTKSKTIGIHSSASNQPLTYASTTTASEVEDRYTNSISDSSTWGVMVAVIIVLLMIIVLLVMCLVALKKKGSKTTKVKRYRKSSESETENTELKPKNIERKAYAVAIESGSTTISAKKVRNKHATKRVQTENEAPRTAL